LRRCLRVKIPSPRSEVKTEVHSKVEGGRLVRNRAALSTALKEFEGKEVTITIAKKKKSRSTQQNRYYWGALLPIVRDVFREAGHSVTIEETHLMLRAKFLNEPLPLGEDGEFIDHIKSTSALTTTQFNEYIDDIRGMIFEYFNIDIPLPNTQIELYSE
jgi:hypothetical protein